MIGLQQPFWHLTEDINEVIKKNSNRIQREIEAKLSR